MIELFNCGFESDINVLFSFGYVLLMNLCKFKYFVFLNYFLFSEKYKFIEF